MNIIYMVLIILFLAPFVMLISMAVVYFYVAAITYLTLSIKQRLNKK